MIATRRVFMGYPYLEETASDGTWIYIYYLYGQPSGPLLIQDGRYSDEAIECPKNWVMV